MKHNRTLALLSVWLLASCTASKQFYLWITASPADPDGINLSEGQLVVELSYDGGLHEIKAPEVASQLSLPSDLTITFAKGSEPSAAHNGGTIGVAIDVLDANGCVVACGVLPEASCCNDTSRLSKDAPIEVELFPIGTAQCLVPATSAGIDCRCGSGTVEAGEICDDGNVVSGDGCRSDCQGREICGDGLVDINEECDDANTQNGDGCENNCQFTIPPTNAPVANADTFTTDEDTPLTILSDALLSNDTDVDSPVLSVVSVNGASNGVVSLSAGQILFTPDANFNGTAGFQYIVSDGALSDTGLVTITVNPVSDPTVATDDNDSTNEDTPLTISASSLLANDIDADADVLTITDVSNSLNGTATLNGTEILFVPSADFNGAASFEYAVSDGTFTDISLVNISVAPVNDAPVATTETLTTSEDVPLSISSSLLLSNDIDVDNAVLSMADVDGAINGAVSLSGEQVTFTPTVDFHGTASFQYTVSDGSLSDVGFVTVIVDPINDAPTAGADAASINEDNNLVRTTAALLANDTDIDGDIVVFIEATNPVNGTVSLSGDVITFSPNADFNGTASFEYTISDGLLFGTAIFTVTVNPINDAPVATDDSGSTNEDTSLNIAISSLLANDINVDTDTLTITTTTNLQGGTAVINGAEILFVPASDFNGTASFDYTVSDGILNDLGSVTITVNPINDPPVATDDVFFTAPDAPLVLLFAEILANDLNVDAGNGDALSILQIGSVTNCAATQTTNQITLTPTVAGFRGFCFFDYTVRDTPGLIDDGFVKVAFGEFCGDGIINNGVTEICDDGELNSDSTPDACRNNCQPASCGDSTTDTGEECDDGDGIEGDGCDTNCTVSRCANGILAPGEICYPGVRAFITANSPADIAIGDLNQDGNLDVVQQSTLGDISVLFGFGDGLFNPQVVSSLGGPPGGPSSLNLGDVNNDGRLDLVEARTNANFVVVRLGNSNGTFQSERFIAVGSKPRSAALSDFNGDGNLDIAAANNNTSGSVSVVLGNGDATFQSASLIFLGSGTLGIAAADFNSDGNSDIVASNNLSSSVSVLLGNGNGTFQSPTTISTPASPAHIDTGDINSDGIVDLALSHGDSGQVSALIGIGNGSFQITSTFGVFGVISDIEVGDFTSDGIPDVVTSNGGIGISIAKGIGAGTFQSSTFLFLFGSSVGVSSADFNQDGVLDVASSGGNVLGAVSILLGGNGNFQSVPTLTSGTPGSGVNDIAAKDFNGDGNTDFATSNTNENDISIFLGDGDGTFQGQLLLGIPSPFSIVAEDFDQDGVKDLITTDPFSNTLRFLKGDGSGGFFFLQSTSVQGPGNLVVAEMNHDGINDLIVLRGNNDALFLRGVGNGTFTIDANLSSTFGSSAAAVADFDEDGNQDVAVVSPGSSQSPLSTVRVIRGNGNGTFQAAASFTTGLGPTGLAVADVNNDNNVDILVGNVADLSNNVTTTISLLLGNGNASFQNQQIISAGISPRILVAEDFNADGNIDIAFVDNRTNALGVLAGSGSGLFEAAQVYVSSAGPTRLISADFNGDTLIDLITINPNIGQGNLSNFLFEP